MIPKGLRRVSETLWELPLSYKEGMRVPARIYGTEKLIADMDAGVFDQISNVACLPGVVRYAYCMPDGHWGYGFPIGGVAAMDPDKGVISPGGIGFDINCGMRLVLTRLTYEEVKPHVQKLVDTMFRRIPSGVGSKGFIKLSRDSFGEVVEQGAGWAVRNGYGSLRDLEMTEGGGCFAGADASKVSAKAVERGFDQVGTLGSGNHYCELQVVKPEHVFDEDRAKVFGFTIPNQVAIMYHCGSRGFGHQVATDYLQTFVTVSEKKYGISVADKELSCAPFRSRDGQEYFAAMTCAVNMAFANRQVILHRLREVFADVFGRTPEELGMDMVYDVAHNTAKLEEHEVDGKRRNLLVHRKGSTRAFGPGMEQLPERYREAGQPVIIGGSMETGSYLLAGLESAAETFYSTAHGSGRTMSRHQAKKMFRGDKLQKELEMRGIYIRTASWAGLAEEAGVAYKSIDEVVEATELAGLSRRVVRLIPFGNIKG